MENDYRITKLHGTFIGDNRIPDLPVGETAKILSSTNGKTAWVDLPTDIGKDANGFAILCHDGTELAGQRKTVKLADVRENGAVIGRDDQLTSAPQTDELITKAYADKEYVQLNKSSVFSEYGSGIEFQPGTKLKTENIYGGVGYGDGFVTIFPDGDDSKGISFISAGTQIGSIGTTAFTGVYFGSDIYGGGDLSALNPAWKSIYGMVSAFQGQWNLMQGGFEALGFTNSKSAEERATTPNPSRLTFFSPIGTVSYYDLAGNSQYDYQLPKKSGTIALTSDLSEAGTSVTIRRW